MPKNFHPPSQRQWAWVAVLLAASVSPFTAVADDASTEVVEFNSSFLRSDVDISQFSQGNPVEPGRRRVDLYLNDGWKGLQSVHFELPSPNSKIALPCYDLQLLNTLGVDLDKLPAEKLDALRTGQLCGPFSELFNGAQARFDSASQSLYVSVPQIFLLRYARGYVNPGLWDNGIPAATLQYNYSGYHTEQSGLGSQSSQYLGLRTGLNWDVWRLRHRGAFNWTDKQGTHYRNSAIFLERGVNFLHSKLVLGESSTDGQVFNSLSFRGMQLMSDDRMYPDSQRGFAPVIRGIANTNALVQVRQKDTLIYETTVPPGPFVIDDLYPTGRGGDLMVTVKEADGSSQSFAVAFDSIPELLRPGVTRYSLMAGFYHNRALDDSPAIAVGTLRHGFSNLLTGYGGVIAAQGYAAGSAGLALNTKAGAFSLSATHSQTQLAGFPRQQGQSWQLSYAYTLPATDTRLNVSAYNNSHGYYDADSAFMLRDRIKSGALTAVEPWNYRNRLTISASQNLPAGYGSLSLNYAYQNYWQQAKASNEFQLSYSNTFKKVSFNLSAQRSRDLLTSKWNNRVMVSLSIPFGSGNHAAHLSTSLMKEGHSESFNNSLSGNFGADRQLSYNVFTNTSRDDDTKSKTTFGAGGSWSAPYANISGNVSSGQSYTQYSASLSGGVVAYADGIVLAPSLGDTITIVEAKNAEGAKIAGYNGLRLDRNGRAVVPYLSPYRQNAIEIDPKGLSTDVEFLASRHQIAPTAGAVTRLSFETDTGYSILVNARQANGNPLPFGAAVQNQSHENLGYMAQGGQSIIRVKDTQGVLFVKWGSAPENQCRIRYEILPSTPVQLGGYRRLDLTCD